MNVEMENLRRRAVALGNAGGDGSMSSSAALDELKSLLSSGYPAVRRAAASELIAAIESASQARQARHDHWCARCRKTVTPEESAAGLAKYGKAYCWHCLHERELEDANFTATVEAAKRLRTVDDVAVQSQGERRIGDWLAAHGIAYVYDERFLIARDARIRPDFYLPEHDLYIEYWGMDTPEYVANMRKKRFLYQQARKKLVSVGWQDLPSLEATLASRLARLGVRT